MHNRRSFLSLAARGAGAIALSGSVLATCNGARRSGTGKPFGIQLYSLKDEMARDPLGSLRALAGYGYRQIESFEGDKGMFWGMAPKEYKRFTRDLNLNTVSSHCDINKDFERKAGEAAEAGLRYLICPYLGAKKSMDEYRRAADKFNECGAVCKREGLRFAYHNHDYSFKPLEGQFPQDVMMQGTDKDTVDYEMDIYWVVTAGQDPHVWFDRYPDRFRLAHIKDRSKTAAEGDGNASVNLGVGRIAWATVLAKGAEKGLKYYLVEQEKFTGSTPLQSAEANARYMQQSWVKG